MRRLRLVGRAKLINLLFSVLSIKNGLQPIRSETVVDSWLSISYRAIFTGAAARVKAANPARRKWTVRSNRRGLRGLHFCVFWIDAGGCRSSSSFYFRVAPLFRHRFKHFGRFVPDDIFSLGNGTYQAAENRQTSERQVSATVIDTNLRVNIKDRFRRREIPYSQRSIRTPRDNSEGIFLAHY
jgi:hypothetical protein